MLAGLAPTLGGLVVPASTLGRRGGWISSSQHPLERAEPTRAYLRRSTRKPSRDRRAHRRAVPQSSAARGKYSHQRPASRPAVRTRPASTNAPRKSNYDLHGSLRIVNESTRPDRTAARSNAPVTQPGTAEKRVPQWRGVSHAVAFFLANIFAGAVIYARQRPDPWPRWFGFHEILPALVIVAAAPNTSRWSSGFCRQRVRDVCTARTRAANSSSRRAR